MKLAIDTNVVFRFLLADDIKQATTARKVMKEAVLVTIPLPVLCEVVWNLSRGYKLADKDIADAIPNEFRVTARRQGCETDERRHTT